MLKIALIGYGKMGKMVEQMARNKGHDIVTIIDPIFKNLETERDSLEKADVCIEFTRPSAVLENIQRTLRIGKPLVVGTTGWDNALDDVKRWVSESGTGLFYASNFSLGVNLFLKTVEKAAELFLTKGDYDVAGVEVHHRQKVDTPSGTAISVQKAVAAGSKREKESIPFSSVRCGSVPGTHTVYFDSPSDTVTISHQARNREDFALGAVAAAEWIQNKKGVYTMEDLLCHN